MVLGFVMARRYVLSQQKNQLVQKYLTLKREGKLDSLTAEEKAEYTQLMESLV